ncbi:hypothetical protein NL676_010320 [Syzygium grande]|nr:hypothetical protein NL676_010320 [Syzygium grande]
MAAKLELAIAMATISQACEPWHLDPKIHDQLELELELAATVAAASRAQARGPPSALRFPSSGSTWCSVSAHPNGAELINRKPIQHRSSPPIRLTVGL